MPGGPQIYEFLRRGKGFLAIMGAPGSQWIDADMMDLRKQRTDVVISLLTVQEVRTLKLRDEESACERLRIDFLSFPIEDHAVPDDVTAVKGLATGIRALVDNGKGVVVHCRAGIGRSGVIGASVLLRYGYAPAEAFALIMRHRGTEVPETLEQRRWIEENAEALTEE